MQFGRFRLQSVKRSYSKQKEVDFRPKKENLEREKHPQESKLQANYKQINVLQSLAKTRADER